jgi:hypothetical protein
MAGDFRPTPTQELLLRAALLSGAEAASAWSQWRACADLDHLDPGCFRLLPLLHHNLKAQGISDPLMNKLKGIHRMTWCKNQDLLERFALLLNALHEERIGTMVLKGAAVTLLHYRDHGLRPMQDLDILVRPEAVPAAIALLEQLGWKPQRALPRGGRASFFGTIHSISFADAAGHECDLHWHVLTECCYPRADDDFWEASASLEMHGTRTRALCPADQLLHVCVHGARWNAVVPIRWVADAMVILRTSPDLDWHRLVAQARERRIVLPLRETLQYLRDLLHVPLPAGAMEELASLPVRLVERVEYRARLRRPGRLGFLSEACLRHLAYGRSFGRGSVAANLLTLPRALQHFWQADHLWQVPYCAVAKSWKRMTPRQF